jgi:ferredoxin-NADP reductase
MTTLRMRVRRIDALTPSIRRLLLEPADARALPPFDPGAHVELHVPGESRLLKRAYSLVNATPTGAGADHYEIAVQLEPASTGGSRWVHTLEPGHELDVGVPRNQFPLDATADDVLLIAGGIGITPILAMARALEAAGRRYTLHYAARDAAAMAYRDEVAALAGATCWLDGGDPQRGIPLAPTLGAPRAGRHLYVCGPKGLIGATLAQAKALGWCDDQVHSELFSGALETDADTAFDVELATSGMTLRVETDQSILDAMLAAGLDPLFDCRSGSCGVCVAHLIDGEPDHRDVCLSASDHAAGDFCPCVSRARSGRLVLDL